MISMDDVCDIFGSYWLYFLSLYMILVMISAVIWLGLYIRLGVHGTMSRYFTRTHCPTFSEVFAGVYGTVPAACASLPKVLPGSNSANTWESVQLCGYVWYRG
jgi:hypothetical protein